MLFINEYKSCEISNQNVFQCNVFIFENKRRTGYDIQRVFKTQKNNYFRRSVFAKIVNG